VREYTVEAGRPDTVTEEKLRTLKAHGCKRISINPQTLNDSVLEAIGRKHTAREFYQSFELARRVGFDVINTDIIAGLPTDTVESFKNTVDSLIDLAPENITVHTLSIKRAARLNRGDRGVLENPADKMVEYATKRLLESGYKPYYLYRQKNMLENLENIGWAKSGCESLYNIYIMEEVQTILAMGAGGSTKLVDRENHRLERVFNYKFPLEYNKHFDLMIQRKKETEEFYAK
jgi:oxygen-independent coproporphyrinogen-3 oxidase